MMHDRSPACGQVTVPGLFTNAKAPTLPLGALVSIQNADTSAASHVETPTRRLSAVTAALATVTSESQSVTESVRRRRVSMC
jgi:hypothetical protein